MQNTKERKKLSKRKRKKEKSGILKHIPNEYDLYLMLIPMLLFYLIFSYKPMMSLIIAFKDYSPFLGPWESEWVGLEHFKTFLTSPYAFRTIRNTLMISFATLLFSFPAPIILALIINEVRNARFKKLVQTVTYIPHFISIVVICGMVNSFLSPTSGVINKLIEFFGGDSVYFMSKPELFIPIYILTNIWRNTGYNAIVYIAALTAIPDDLYEAARVDGAGRWKQLCHVTLPGIIPTIVVMLLVQLGKILNVGYEMIILLYNPSTYETADVINTYVYRTGILEGRYDYATAIGLLNSVVALILVLAANRLSRKLTETGLW